MVAHGRIRLQHKTESTPASCSGHCAVSIKQTIFQEPVLHTQNCFPLNGRNRGEQREEKRHPKMKLY